MKNNLNLYGKRILWTSYRIPRNRVQTNKLEKCQEMIIITRQHSKLFRFRCTRKIQRQDANVEPRFTYNKYTLKYRQYLVKGQKSAKTEQLLMATAQNMIKYTIWNKTY